MASPQVEEGFVRVATDLLDALCRVRIPGESRQVFDFILRKTYGFKKKRDHIPLSQFCSGTGLKKPNVCRAVAKLEKMNVIIKRDNGIIKNDNTTISEYGVNKDFDTWKPLSKKIPGVSKEIMKPLSKKRPSIDIRTKDKKYMSENAFSDDFLSVFEAYPRKEGKKEAARVYASLMKKKSATPADILQAARNYAGVKRGTDPKFIKLLSTFLGPDEHWREFLTKAPVITSGEPAWCFNPDGSKKTTQEIEDYIIKNC